MKGYLFRALWKKYWKLLLSMLLVSALGCTAVAGLRNGYLSLKEGLNAYIREGGYPDAVVTTEVVNRRKMEAVRSVPGVAAVDARLVGDVMLLTAQGRYLSIRAMSFDEGEFQQFHIWEQTDPGNLDPVYLDYYFARNNQIAAGDTVLVKIGDEYRACAVAGTVSRPETLATEISDAFSINSDDFGYAYAPRALLEKEVNQEHRDAMREWQKKNSELEDAERSARQDYEAALEQLSGAEGELEEAKTELARQLADMDGQLAELDRSQEELENARKEILQKQREAENSQQELNEKWIAAEEKEAELRQAQTELNEKRAELEEAQKTLIEQRAELEKQRGEAQDQLSALESTEKELLEAQTELEQARAQAIRAQDELIVGREELRGRRREAEQALSALRLAKTYYAQLEDISGLDEAVRQRLESEAGELDADRLRSQLHDLLDGLENVESVTEAALDEAIARVEYALRQIDGGQEQMSVGLRQIKEGLAEADEKETELLEGLRQVQEGKAALKDALKQMDEGLGQMDEGLSQMDEGLVEIEDYQQQLDEGFAELAEGFAQISEYQEQLDEGFAQIKEGKDEIESAFIQLQEGEKQIQTGIAQAESQIAQGEEELTQKRTEVENGWIEALAEFADIKAELQKAAEELSEWEGYQALCNQFLLRLSPGASPEAVVREVQAALGDITVQKTAFYEDSSVARRINGDLDAIEKIVNFIPVFFFALNLVVVYLFMALMIRQCRREIGILRALGFTKLQVISLFCGAGWMVSLGAAALGLVLSLGVRGYFSQYYYDRLLHIPVHTLVFDFPGYLLSAALTCAAVQLSTLLCAFGISSVQPSEAMTRPKPATVKVSRAVRRAIRGAPPFLKFSVVSLLRSRLRFLFSAFCLASSVMMIFTSFSLISSCNEIITQVFGRCIHYDCQIFMRTGAGEGLGRDLSALPYVSQVEPMDYYTVEMGAGPYGEGATVIAVQANTELVSVEDTANRPIPLEGNGIILERHLAENLHAGPGDTVLVGQIPFSVSAVSRQSGSRFQYITGEQASALGECTLHTLILRVPADRENELMQYLADREEVLYVSFTHSAYSAYAVLLSGFKTTSLALIGIAMAIGMVIVINTSQTNLLEQKKELCVLRTLGFQHREVSWYWFFQSILHFLVSCALGFPSGIALTKTMLLRVETGERSYPFANNPMDYALTAAVVLGYIALSHIIAMRSMKQWDLVEAVKEKE